MANRHQRRLLARAARLRCIACEKTGQPKSKEHIWPLWLIERCKADKRGIRWVGPERINPKSITIPLCRTCNNRLGAELEQPVSQIFERLEAGAGIKDSEAALLVCWLWKFEGLFWSINHPMAQQMIYSDRWTLIDRVLGGAAIQDLRRDLTLAIGFVHKNDQGFQDWPMGIDSGYSDMNAIFVSGVFGRTAIMVSLSQFAGLIPNWFGIYQLKPEAAPEEGPCFFPPVCFPTASDAVSITIGCSRALLEAHEAKARRDDDAQMFKIARPRIEIPG